MEKLLTIIVILLILVGGFLVYKHIKTPTSVTKGEETQVDTSDIDAQTSEQLIDNYGLNEEDNIDLESVI